MKTQNIEAKEYFSAKAANYYFEHYGDVNSKTHYPSLYFRHIYTLNMFGSTKKAKALDIGCGSGAMVRELLNRGYDVVAADISQNMLDATRKTVGKHPRASYVKYTIQDIEDLDFGSGSFDLIICTGVIEYLKTDDNALRELSRVLKPGGVAIISTQNKASFARTLLEGLFLIIPTWLKNHIVTIKQHHCHVPWKLDRALAQVGLMKEDFAYHHFYPIPIPFDRVFPRFCVWAGKKMERWSRSRYAWMAATGYVVKVRKLARKRQQITSMASS